MGWQRGSALISRQGPRAERDPPARTGPSGINELLLARKVEGKPEGLTLAVKCFGLEATGHLVYHALARTGQAGLVQRPGVSERLNVSVGGIRPRGRLM